MARAQKLLIVDDEGPLLAYLSRAAKAKGYDVQTARDGEEAWKHLNGGRYDLVVTDLRMCGMDGPELMERIDGRGMRTRVVVITGHATLEAAVDCLRKGAVDFLIKPFEVETFLASVERALGRPLSLAHDGLDWQAVVKQYGLTRSQGKVLKAFYATGKTNRELAEELRLSPHTIKSHLKAAFAKVGVSNRVQLLQKLRATG